MGDKFCNHYVNHTEEGHTGFSMDMARKRLQLGESLYYKVLEKIINDEKRRLKSETDLSGIYLIIWLDDLIFESNNYFARSDYFRLPSSFPIWVEYFWANFVCYHEYSTSNYLSFSKFFSCLLLLVFDLKKMLIVYVLRLLFMLFDCYNHLSMAIMFIPLVMFSS